MEDAARDRNLTTSKGIVDVILSDPQFKGDMSIHNVAL